MPLVACPECGRSISTEAKACPGCGFPIAEGHGPPALPAAPAQTVEAVETVERQTVLLEVRSSWWNFFWHLFFFWLIVPPLIAICRRQSFLMRIFSDRVSVSEGFWSKESSEFFIKDIRSIDVRQGFWGRLVNIGDVTISTAATVDAAEVAPGVPEPGRIKELLIAQRQQSPT